jgi:hypothetical protein
VVAAAIEEAEEEEAEAEAARQELEMAKAELKKQERTYQRKQGVGAVKPSDEKALKKAKLKVAQVRKTPSWPRSWVNFSLLSLYSHRNAWANLHLLGQPVTLFSLPDGGKVQEGGGRGTGRTVAVRPGLPLQGRLHRGFRVSRVLYRFSMRIPIQSVGF